LPPIVFNINLIKQKAFSVCDIVSMMKKNTRPSGNTRNDADLVLSARSGDAKAFDQLMNRYKSTLYFKILKMVKNDTDAEDLTIESFEKAFKNIKKCQPQYSFSTWLFSVATHHTIDHLRKKMIVFVPLKSPDENDKNNSDESFNDLVTTTENPEEILIKKQNINLLSVALSSLKPKYQVMVKLRYLKEFSYSEIAKELNLPLSTVKIQLFRSRLMLYHLLKNTGISY